ncbi:translation initiation factor IF-2 [Chlamydiifrater phoenicopteri]|uniref:translation initiation factor IF-2 n=1 Tax=Chlamydiifrater phoenicopteri TaxID=2681469 RepID=UPI001BCECB3D|nr:translation initiation factor IF-2 [Chlamydiifrater phoenicopteri]
MESIKLTKNLKLKIKNSKLTKAAGLDKLKAKLAQAGSEAKPQEEKSGVKSAKSKSAKITQESAESASSSSSTLTVESGFGESSPPRRIRAKSKSSFTALEEAIIPQEEPQQSLEVESSLEQQEEALPEVSPSPSKEVSPLENSFTPDESSNEEAVSEGLEKEEFQETPTIASTTIEKAEQKTPSIQQESSVEKKPAKVTIKSKFGPTGKHINHLLSKVYNNKSDSSDASEPSSTQVSAEASEEGSSPASPSKKTDLSAGAGNNSRGFLRKDSKKSIPEFRDGRKKSSESVKSFSGRDRYGLNEGSDDDKWRKKRTKQKKSYEDHVVQRPTSIKVPLPITVKDLAAEMKLKASELIQKMFIHGMTYVVNDVLDDETTVQFIGSEFGCTVEIDHSEKEKIQVVSNSVKEEVNETSPEKLAIRPPVVAFMGHVDHGKTSLIDALRKSNIASGEAGAITQHMGAFRCSTPVGDITILDTPGHEAFSAMRARGAEICDIVVLVVAGDEGIKEQTTEAIKHALTAGIVIVVAINKADKPNFNAENVYRQLSEFNLLPEAWGGTTATVNTSAKTGEGLTELLEMLALQAEVLELKADPSNRARGLVIESELHKGLGHVATVLVQNGTLRVGDSLVFNDCYGRIKTMHDEHNHSMKEACPATPALITGLSGIPKAGDPFVVVKNEKTAKEIIEARIAGKQRFALQQKRNLSFDALLQNRKVLKLIVKADVQGSIEALVGSIAKIKSDKVKVDIVSTGVGEISESDIRLAAASKTTILGFHTSIESHAEPLIKSLGVRVKLHDIIYHAIDDVEAMMADLLDPIMEEKPLGSAEIKEIFKSSQLGCIYGCLVVEGSIVRNQKVNLVRNKEVIWKGSISSLKRIKEDVREVKKGLECGVLLDGYGLAKIGDTIQCYEIIYHPQKL